MFWEGCLIVFFKKWFRQLLLNLQHILIKLLLLPPQYLNLIFWIAFFVCVLNWSRQIIAVTVVHNKIFQEKAGPFPSKEKERHLKRNRSNFKGRSVPVAYVQVGLGLW